MPSEQHHSGTNGTPYST